MGGTLGHKERKTSDLIRTTSRFVVYTVTLATLAFGGSKLFTSEARAEPPKSVLEETSRRPTGPKEELPPGPKEDLPLGSKEAETPKAPKPLHPELAKLKKVSLVEMQKLVKETCERYRCFNAVNKVGFWQGSVVDISLPDGWVSVVANIGTNKETGKFENYLIIAANGEVVAPPEFDEIVATPEFDELARLYKLATGNKLKYVRFAINHIEKDADGDTGVGIYVIPVEKPDGEIKAGTSIESYAYILDSPNSKAIGKVYQHDSLLLSEEVVSK